MGIVKLISWLCALSASFVMSVAISNGNIPTGFEATILMLLYSIVVRQQGEGVE